VADLRDMKAKAGIVRLGGSSSKTVDASEVCPERSTQNGPLGDMAIENKRIMFFDGIFAFWVVARLAPSAFISYLFFFFFF
jgi:hypothetical protein